MIDKKLLDRLLIADVDELRGEGETEVARHVRMDPAARAAARRVLDDTRAMDAALSDFGVSSATAAHDAMDAAWSAVGLGATASDDAMDAASSVLISSANGGPRGRRIVEVATAGAPGRARRLGSRAKARVRHIGWGLGLAAAIAAIIIARADMPTGETQRTLAPVDEDAAAADAAPEPPLTATLGVESDRRFAVFATDNPNIAVVWLFDDQEGQ